MNIGSWNINGWNENNSLIRENILLSLSDNVWFITETHLKTEENIHVPGLKWIGQNRLKYKSPSRGIGFIIHLKLYSWYHVKSLESGFESILVMSLIHNHSGFYFITAGIYIPLKSSPYISHCKCNCDTWFNHLACLLARYENNDNIPNEIPKNNKTRRLVYYLLYVCFHYSINCS